MNLSAGNIPNEFNVIIEIPANSDPIKYELDKDTGLIFVDRFMGTSMVYPTNYGFVPSTLSKDGDPVDVLLISPFSLLPGVVVKSRAIGLLQMEDESGLDSKVIAVPTKKICPMYEKVSELNDLPKLLKDQIKHFFEHYKDLEPGKWVKVQDWKDVDSAHEELISAERRFKSK